MKFDIINLDGNVKQSCSHDSILQCIEEGQLVILRNCLQEFQLFDQLQKELIARVQQVCGPEAASGVEAQGVENIHQFADIDQIEKIYKQMRVVLRQKMPAVTAAMFRSLGAVDTFHVNNASLLRIMMPYGFMKAKQKTFKQHLGKLTMHGPHHDHYQNVPINAINSWIAIGRVAHENGIFIFPDVWGMNLPQGKEVVRDDQYLGKPISIQLEPGDALFFHSNHMHSSRLNTTDESRVVLTNRICMDLPKYPDPELPQTYFYSDAFPHDTDLSTIFSRDGFVGDEENILKTPLEKSASELTSSSKVESASLPPITLERTRGNESTVPELPQFQLDENEIAIVDAKTCVAKVDGELLTFPRRCTHEGADLSLGFVENGKIVCPYHGLKFCAKTGESNCSAAANLKINRQYSDVAKRLIAS